MQAHKKGVLQHDQLYKLVHDSVHDIEDQLRKGGWLKDGRLLLGQQVCWHAGQCRVVFVSDMQGVSISILVAVDTLSLQTAGCCCKNMHVAFQLWSSHSDAELWLLQLVTGL